MTKKESVLANINDIIETLNRRPAVHKLCINVFIQEPIWFCDDVLIVPLRSFGSNCEASYVSQYVKEILNEEISKDIFKTLLAQGENACPVVSIIKFLKVDAPPSELESYASSDISLAEKALAWASGGKIMPFAFIVSSFDNSMLRLVVQDVRQVTRLGFGNTGKDYYAQVKRIVDCARTDELFDFVLSLYMDAMRETNYKFAIARLYNCLEAMASNLKHKYNGADRKAVKALLGLESGAIAEVVVDGQKYRFDVVEIAGRIRAKFFHGRPFDSSDLNQETKHVISLYEQSPKTIADMLQGYCEIEIARWANGVSRGLEQNNVVPSELTTSPGTQ